MIPKGPQTPIPRTPKQIHRRLQPAQVDEVVSRHLAGATLKELGNEYQVHRTTIPNYWSNVACNFATDLRVWTKLRKRSSSTSRVYRWCAVGEVQQVNSGTFWQALKRQGVPLRDCHGRTRQAPPKTQEQSPTMASIR